MKIAISAEGNELESNLDLRFGRANGFIVYDLNTNEFIFLDNVKNLNALQGAGIQAAQAVIEEDVCAIVTGYCGPKAYKVLEAADVKIFVSEKDIVKNVIKKFKNDELQEQVKDF